ncbi:MAG: hypothetical protein IKT03_06790 [Muribaculaceae bacterium]|nr:hypothetical protein [Muribaculaceae bacterium]
MKNLTKTILLLAIITMPAFCFAQPQSCKVTFTGKQPTIKDFARAYCSQFEAGSFERKALANFSKGSHQSRVVGGCNDCFVDIKNGYVSFIAFKYGKGGTIENQESIEMCYWNCDNKNEKLVAVNSINNCMGFDESFLYFYRYNVKTKTMKLIKAPFDRSPKAIDMVDKSKADKKTVNMVQSARNEDANKYQPCFQLPHTGKNITYRMADRTAIPKKYQRECKLIWNGSSFIPED